MQFSQVRCRVMLSLANSGAIGMFTSTSLKSYKQKAG